MGVKVGDRWRGLVSLWPSIENNEGASRAPHLFALHPLLGASSWGRSSAHLVWALLTPHPPAQPSMAPASVGHDPPTWTRGHWGLTRHRARQEPSVGGIGGLCLPRQRSLCLRGTLPPLLSTPRPAVREVREEAGEQVRQEVAGAPGQAPSAPAPSGHTWQVPLTSASSPPPAPCLPFTTAACGPPPRLGPLLTGPQLGPALQRARRTARSPVCARETRCSAAPSLRLCLHRTRVRRDSPGGNRGPTAPAPWPWEALCPLHCTPPCAVSH